MPTMTNNLMLTQFANECRTNVHLPWDTLGATVRARKIYTAVTRVLTACNIPVPALQLLGNLGGASGQFYFPTWKLQIDPNEFGANITPNRDEFLEVATLIYHEARHCEQWFHMARYAAVGHQMTAQKLANQLYIPLPVANSAFTRKMRIADPMLRLTKNWYESVYGGKSLFREITLGGLMMRRRGDNALMNTFRNGFHQRYSGNLPEEVDAWGIQDLVANVYPN